MIEQTEGIQTLELFDALPSEPESGRSLEELECVIERGQRTFLEVGRALLEIRDGRLYRQQYPTFEEYCRERWGWRRDFANKQIRAASVVDSMDTNVSIPAHESQARELAHIPDPEERAAVWQESVAQFGEQPTANEIVRIAHAMLPDSDESCEPDEEPPAESWQDSPRQSLAEGDVSEAIALVPARTDTKWFRTIWRHADRLCFIEGRLRFSGHENSAPFPSALVYFGVNVDGFEAVMVDFGAVVAQALMKEGALL